MAYGSITSKQAKSRELPVFPQCAKILSVNTEGPDAQFRVKLVGIVGPGGTAEPRPVVDRPEQRVRGVAMLRWHIKPGSKDMP